MRITSMSKQLNVLKVWVLPLVSLVALIIAGIYVINPWVTDIFEKQNAITSSEEELSALLSKLEILNEQDPESLRDYLVQLTLAVPPKSSPPIVLATVERAITEAGLSVESINFGGLSDVSESTVSELGQSKDPKEDTSIDIATVSQGNSDEEIISGGKVAVQFSAVGDYYQMVRFLKIVNKINPMILGVDFSVTLGVSSSSGDSGDSTVQNTFSYSGIAPYQGLPTDLGALTTDVQPLSQKELGLIDALTEYSTFFEVKSEVEEIQSYEVGKDNPF